MKYIILLILTIFSYLVKGQGVFGGVEAGEKDLLGREQFFFDAQGRALNRYVGVTGDPFLLDKWITTTKLVLLNGSTIRNYKVKFNTNDNSILFLDSLENAKVAMPLLVKELRMADPAELNKSYCIKTGFPPIEKQTEETYYLILSEGKCSLLNYQTKAIVTTKNDLSGEISKDFEKNDTYYLYFNNTMLALKKSKNFLLEILHDKETDLENYIEENKISFKKIEDITRLINYYNTLK
jgi:hypothetical protein